VHTKFDEVARRSTYPARSSPEFNHVSAETVARIGLDAVEHDRALVIPGLVMKLVMFFVRLTPMWILRLASGLSAKRA
jgi:short-subunit dehydrogenase